MRCPTCPNTLLVISERQGVEIDYCPQCRGVWLDRGELDKLLDRAAAQAAVPSQPVRPDERRLDSGYGPAYPDPRQYDPRHHHSHKKHTKYKSWLSEIFD